MDVIFTRAVILGFLSLRKSQALAMSSLIAESTKLQTFSSNMVNNGTFPITLDNPSLLEHRGFIAGSWRAVKDGKAFPVYEPSTGTVLHCCSDFSREDFSEAIESAYEGYRAYFETTTAAERANILRKWHYLVQKNLNDRKSDSRKCQFSFNKMVY